VSEIDMFRYERKRVLVVGGATGMGAAAAQIASSLGAEVVVMDIAPIEYPVAKAVYVDLRDRATIDDALKEVEAPIDAIFSAAGVAQGSSGLMKVNFIGHRHIIETMLEDGRLIPGSAVCMISSVGGLGWQSQLPVLLEFLEHSTYESAVDWIDAHEGTDNYGFSKQAMNCYVAQQAYPFMTRGVRINAICPAPTDTPLARANAAEWLTFAQDYRDATGTTTMNPEQMGRVMTFLNSDAAIGISGVNVLVDDGYVMSSLVNSYPPGHPIVDMLMNLSS
jgi:NAD(P)-dependent dehydrogenase (short-subunit alcohol dehydrogenase family)